MVLGFITVSCFFLIPAAIFSVLEDDWNFLESFYFCFISLSTIGLGDYVPGEGYNQKFRELYKIGITCKCQTNQLSKRHFILKKKNQHQTDNQSSPLYSVNNDHLSASKLDINLGSSVKRKLLSKVNFLS